MRIDGLRFATGLHEGKHASYGASWHFGITEVHVDLSGGHVAWDLDFPCAANVAEFWQWDPEAATTRVRRALGAMLAPHDGERFPGPCPDATLVGELGRAWQRLPRLDGRDPAPWRSLLTQAHGDIRRWLWRPGAVGALEELAARLAQAGTLDGAGWQALWEQPWCHPLRQPAARAPQPTPAPRTARPAPYDADQALKRFERYYAPYLTQKTVPLMPDWPLDWRMGGIIPELGDGFPGLSVVPML